MKKIVRIVVYFLAFVLPPVVAGLASISSLPKAGSFDVQMSAEVIARNATPPVYDSKKPTVAIMLGDEKTEAIDFMAPYQLFAASEAFNVYAIAPEKRPTTLTGGLKVMPHYSYDELDEMLKKEPDVIVIPFIPPGSEKGQQAVHDYLLKHSSEKTILLSICNGAENLASTGLLDGLSATTHWGDINGVEKKYPQVNWVRGLRYVDSGHIVNSSGLSSGIDASLYVIAKFAGEDTSKKLAKSINYPTYHFVDHPQMEQYKLQLSDAYVYLNYAFKKKEQTGVLLYQGMDELSLITLFDTYPATGTTRLITIADSMEPIQTKHHLYLFAQYDYASAPKVDRMLLAGAEAKALADTDIRHWNTKNTNTELVYLNADAPERYVLEPILEDLAKHTDVLTAKYAARRLEYRGDDMHLAGSFISLGILLKPLLIGLVALLLVIYLLHFRRSKTK
ncbi:DJ-1/PfpI family protein [Paenibacillus sinopodophylli]|uniref:DJ-1/PfpI family protein n=1 Tax=Paenibacillus sinopodophylli TaxID=1837342 RepID=UPI00110C9FF4|nr:DJ-1/PfpI family protein [Paenibacillus sinopodophylli]